MSVRLRLLALLLVGAGPLAAPALGQDCTRWVSPDGPTGTGSGDDPANTWSLADANARADAPDVVCLLDGVYTVPSNQQAGIWPTKGGSSHGRRLVFRNAPGSTPILTHAVYHNENACVRLWDVDFVTVQGIACRGSESGIWPFTVDFGVDIRRARYNVVRDSTLHFLRGKGVILVREPDTGPLQEYNAILDNHIAHIGCNPFLHPGCPSFPNVPGDGINIGRGSSRNLVRGNFIGDVGHDAILIRNLSYGSPVEGNLIDDNQLENAWWTAADVAQEAAGQPVRRNVFQRNRMALNRAQASNPLDWTNQGFIGVGGPETIIRFNRMVDGAGGIRIGSGNTVAPWRDLRHNKIYNNHIVGGAWPAVSIIVNTTGIDLRGNSVVNNLFSANNTAELGFSELPNPQAQIWTRFENATPDLGGSEIRNNFVIEDRRHEPEDPRRVFALAGLPGCQTVVDQGTPACSGANTVVADNVDSGALVDAGAFLTTVTEQCGIYYPWIPVVDAGSFFRGIDDRDADGRPGPAFVPADVVQLEGGATPYQIVQILEFQAFPVLEVSPWPTCATGQRLSLAYTGAAPDIGAAPGQ